MVTAGCSTDNKTDSKSQSIDTDMKVTESGACNAILRDLKIAAESELGVALRAEKYHRDATTGTCIIETGRERFSFNVTKMEFTIIRGIDPKTGSPHRSRGELYIDESGRLRARFG